MGKVTQGTRVQTVGELYAGPPGGYCLASDGKLWIKDPSGHVGRTGGHSVSEHEDGTITVAPSILATVKDHGHDWHGWLQRGVWTEC